MFNISSLKKFAMFFRTSIKIIVLTIVSVFLIIGAIAFFYKPTYAVSLNGELIGYTENKSELQNKINQYMEGNTEEGIAFRQIDSVPEYTLCLLKKDITTNDDEIYSKAYKYINLKKRIELMCYCLTNNIEKEAAMDKIAEIQKLIFESFP